MAVQFRLAAFGHTMETGRVVEWHITEGSRIEEGQPWFRSRQTKRSSRWSRR